MRLIVLCLIIAAYPSIHTMKSPVVVVGSGLAGLMSAHKLLSSGVPVIMLEKGDKFGGNSIKASSGINGVYTETQSKLNIDDSFDQFYDDTARSGKGAGNPNLQRLLVAESEQEILRLQKMGVSLGIVNRLGGHSQARTHRSEGIPPGFEIMSKLMEQTKHLEGFDLRYQSRLVGIDVKNLTVKGVRYVDMPSGEEKYLSASHVVVATGGFGYSKELLQKYRPELASFPTTNDKNTLGEGQLLLQEAGADLIDMEEIQIHPTGFIKQDDRDNNWKFLAAESLRGVGGVLLNSQLERFVNELSTRDIVSTAILNQEGKKAYLVLSQSMYEDFKFQIDFYAKMKLLERCTLREKFGERSEHAAQLLRDYSDSTDSFGREHKQHTFTGISPDTELFIGEITPVVHFTMGGAKIDENAAVINTDGEAIGGLYAAGEVSGGVHGKNRLAGNSLLECMVFSTRAVRQIAREYGVATYL